MRIPLFRVVTFLLAFSLFARGIQACECISFANTYERYRGASAVFIVTVSDVYGTSAQVEKAWKGKFKRGDIITLHPTLANCSFTFDRNAAYLVFSPPDYALSSGSICSGNGQVEARQKEIRLLDRWSWWWWLPLSEATNRIRRIGEHACQLTRRQDGTRNECRRIQAALRRQR